MNGATTIIWTIAAVGYGIAIYGFAPGLLSPDSLVMLDGAQSLHFNDWHSPSMQAIWAVMHRLIPGSLGMLALIQITYWGGFALIGTGLSRYGWPVLGVVITLLALVPASLHMTSLLLRDVPMATFFLVAVGLLVLSITAARWRISLLVGAAVFICLGIAMRPNAFAGAFPLIVLWVAGLHPDRAVTWRTWGASAIAAVLLFVAITQAERAALNPRRTNVERSLLIFDLGGITYFSGRDQFDGLLGSGFVEMNARSCYDGAFWNAYIWGNCKHVDPAITQAWTPGQLATRWVEAILDYPLAYLKHRANHFGWLITNTTNFTAAMVRDWGGRTFRQSAIYDLVEASAVVLYPIWPPYLWCAVLIVTLALAPLSRDWLIGLLAGSLASSGLAHMALYLFASVATDWRYGYWTQITATICMALCVAIVSSVSIRAPAKQVALRRATGGASSALPLLPLPPRRRAHDDPR